MHVRTFGSSGIAWDGSIGWYPCPSPSPDSASVTVADDSDSLSNSFSDSFSVSVRGPRPWQRPWQRAGGATAAWPPPGRSLSGIAVGAAGVKGCAHAPAWTPWLSTAAATVSATAAATDTAPEAVDPGDLHRRMLSGWVGGNPKFEIRNGRARRPHHTRAKTRPRRTLQVRRCEVEILSLR